MNNYTMSTITPVLPISRRRFLFSLSSACCLSRAYSYFPPARRRYPFQQYKHQCISRNRRAFSTTPWRHFADVVDDAFDPRQRDRESDVVDVCIVGGGKIQYIPFPAPHITNAIIVQVPLVSAPPFVSNSSPMKPIMKTSGSWS